MKSSFLALPVVVPHGALCFLEVSFIVYFKLKKSKEIGKVKFQISPLSIGCYWVLNFLPSVFLVPSLSFTWCLFFLRPKSSEVL